MNLIRICAVALAVAPALPGLAAPEFFSLPGNNSWRCTLETTGSWNSNGEFTSYGDVSQQAGFESHAAFVFDESGFGVSDDGFVRSHAGLDAVIGSGLITAAVSSSFAYNPDGAAGSNGTTFSDLNATGRFILLEAATVRVTAHASQQFSNSDVVAGLLTADFSTIFAAAFPGDSVDVVVDLAPGEYLFTVQAGMSFDPTFEAIDIAQSAGISIRIVPATASALAFAGLGALGLRRRR